MPIYGYRCSQCGHELEVFQSMSDAPLRACPECGGMLRKLIFPVGVHFKGSGFYTTDYKIGSSSSSETSSSSDGPDGSGDSKKGASETSSEKKKKSESAASKE